MNENRPKLVNKGGTRFLGMLTIQAPTLLCILAKYGASKCIPLVLHLLALTLARSSVLAVVALAPLVLQQHVQAIKHTKSKAR